MITLLDIYLEKLRKGWTLDDLPNEAIRNDVELAMKGKYYEN